MNDPQEIIKDEVVNLITSEAGLTLEVRALEHELIAANPKFQVFLEKQAELRLVQARNEEAWKRVEQEMIEHDIKSIKGEWGSLTIAERLNWDYDPTMLAPKFFKKVVDTKKLSDTFRLEGKEPKGATAKYSKFLTKRLK